MPFLLQHVSVPRPPGEASAQMAREFYGELIGLPEKSVPQSIAHLDLVWFSIGTEMELHVYAEPEKDALSGRHFCLQVENVEVLREAFIQRGYQPRTPEEIPGRPRFFCRDPFDNLVEFAQITDDYLKYQP